MLLGAANAAARFNNYARQPLLPIKRHKDDRLGTEVRTSNRGHPTSTGDAVAATTARGPRRERFKRQLRPRKSPETSVVFLFAPSINLTLFPTVFVKQTRGGCVSS